MELMESAVLMGAGIIAALVVCRRRFNTRKLSSVPTVWLHGRRKYRFTVVGASIYRSALERLCGVDLQAWHGRKLKAILVPEYGSPNKDDAVRVEINGRTVGYLPGDAAFECCRRLRASGSAVVRGQCRARITVLSQRQRKRYSEEFAIHLDLPAKR